MIRWLVSWVFLTDDSQLKLHLEKGWEPFAVYEGRMYFRKKESDV